MKIIYLKIVFAKNTHQNEIMDGAEAEAVLDSVKKRDGISRGILPVHFCSSCGLLIPAYSSESPCVASLPYSSEMDELSTVKARIF